MKDVSLAAIQDASSRLLLDLSKEECETLLRELSALKQQMDAIAQIEGIDEREPMTFPFDCATSDLREDEPEKPLSVEEALANAGSCEDNQIKLPKVVG